MDAQLRMEMREEKSKAMEERSSGMEDGIQGACEDSLGDRDN